MFAAMAGEAGCQPDEIAAMSLALPARGDSRGRAERAPQTWIDESGAFAAGCRPVELLPEDGFDSQPFVDHELIFVCRARLDDRRGLLHELQIEPARGAALSDAAILRQCYRKWREETPRHIYGDFAFVAWERWSRRTVAATDHLANFRLFHCRAGGRILFATQLGALLACPRVHPGLDRRALGLMVANRPGQRWTMFNGLSVLAGGELLVHQDEMVRIERWWRPDTNAREVHQQVRDYVEETRALFDSAVAARLRARGGVIATLSGGLDSTLVAVTAARRLAATGKLLEAFTATADQEDAGQSRGSENDDTPWAAAVADYQPNIRQRLVSPDGLTPLDILPVIHALSHTPIRDPARLVWTWQMSIRAAHNRARVILCGDHGKQSISYAGDLCDASFIRLRQIAGAAQRTWDHVRGIGSHPHNTRAAIHGEQTQPRSLRPGCEVLLRKFCADNHDDLLEAPMPTSEREIFVRAVTGAQRAARVDFMAQFGLEWLDPTGDRKLLERLLTYPLHVFRVGNRPRGLARELGRAILPEHVRLRRSRGAPFPDQMSWFTQRAQDYRTVLRSVAQSPTCAAFLDFPRLESLLDGLCAGKGTAAQAALVHRALDAGLFAVSYESSHALARADSPEVAVGVPTLSAQTRDLSRAIRH